MKKLFAVLLGILCLASVAMAQEVKMNVELRDGSTLIYDIDSIERLESTDVPYPWNRIVELSEYHYEFDQSEALTGNFMRFRRQDGLIYLRTPNGRLSQISGIPSQERSFTEFLTFLLVTADPAVYQLNSTQEWSSYYNTSWSQAGIHASQGASSLWLFILDSTKNLVSQGPADHGQHPVNHEVNLAGDKVAFILWHNYEAVGRLAEMNLTTGAVDTLVKDTTINSVRYDESTGDVIYYSVGHYGKDNPSLDDAGYYRFEKSTRTSSLLLKHRSPRVLGQEYWNGFDISSDGKKLLVPHPTKYSFGKPIFMEYELGSESLDTLDIEIPDLYNDEVWGQYSHDDSLILFSITTRWGTGAGESLVGVHDRHTKRTKPIVVSPSNQRPFSAPYPRWSPDDQAICYGGCEIPVNTLDYVGPFQVYIKPLEW